MRRFDDVCDEPFSPSGIVFCDPKQKEIVIQNASNIANRFPDLYEKHVYGQALRYSLVDNRTDFVMDVDRAYEEVTQE